ncbi:hypothetical protein [Desulfatirhabdium butyrativorans]|uniref:hypothetical protein n=1 Tax=Desulfatirhabdium butyrativorans TaxID=340467 RepID=UPI0004077ACF|nr:hypothetical protein [Desulfatirhabdium butyrativorans]
MNEIGEISRLDRIEQSIESLVEAQRAFLESQKGQSAQIAELREAQKKTDEQINRTDAKMAELRDAQLKTDAQIAELRAAQKITGEQIAELREAQKKTDEQMNRTDAKMAELRDAQLKTDAQIAELRAAQKITGEQIAELREAQKKTEELMDRTEAQMRRTDEKLARVAQQLGEMGLVQGEVAEDLFYRNVSHLFRPLLKAPLGSVHRNLRPQGRRDVGEYDIVADTGRRVLVIEVKNKLSTKYVDDFLRRKLPRFKDLFPEYADRDLLAGVGALVVKDEVGRYAEDAGLYVMTQTTDGGATLLNRKGFKPKVFR